MNGYGATYIPRSEGKWFVKGFTTVELLTVVMIAAILTAIAAPSFSNLTARQRTKNVATDLYVALAKTRSEALKRNTNVTLSPLSTSWQGGWQILDASNNVLDSHGAISGVTITSALTSVVYQNSGRISGNTTPSFQTTASAASTVQSCVSTTLSGRPYVKGVAC